MNSKPFFSIVVPTYNRAKLIERPVRSVIDQTFQDWELIIVDDGSTDDTEAIISAYHEKRIRYYYKKREERSIARNFGVSVAKGEYLCFLDSDDYYLPNHLETHFQLINKMGSPIAAVYSGTLMEKDNVKEPDFHLFQNENVIENLWNIGYNLLPFSFHQLILKKIIFDPELIYMEDLNFLLSVFKDFEVFPVFTRTNVVVIHEFSSTKKQYRQALKENGDQNIFAIDKIIQNHASFLLMFLNRTTLEKRKKRIIFRFLKASMKRLDFITTLYFFRKYMNT